MVGVVPPKAGFPPGDDITRTPADHFELNDSGPVRFREAVMLI